MKKEKKITVSHPNSLTQSTPPNLPHNKENSKIFRILHKIQKKNRGQSVRLRYKKTLKGCDLFIISLSP